MLALLEWIVNRHVVAHASAVWMDVARARHPGISH